MTERYYVEEEYDEYDDEELTEEIGEELDEIKEEKGEVLEVDVDEEVGMSDGLV